VDALLSGGFAHRSRLPRDQANRQTERWMNASSLSLLLEYAHNAALQMVGLLVYALIRPRLTRYPDWLRQIFEGLVFSLLIGLTMLAPLQFSDGATLNLRSTLVCLSVIFGGPLCGLIAAVVGFALRAVALGGNTELGTALIVLPYALGVAYAQWARGKQRKIAYRDLIVLGIGIDFCRVLAWLIVANSEFVARVNDPAWLGILLLVPLSVVLLGGAVLLVEERRALAQAVADSEARFRGVLDQLPDNLSLFDLQDRFTFVNKSLEAMMGISRDRALGRPRQDVWKEIGADVGDEQHQALRRFLETRQTLRMGPLLMDIKGRANWIVATLFPVRNAKGEILETATVGNSVDDLIQVREDLARREEIAQRHKNALLAAVRASRIDRPVEETIRALTEIAGETLEVDHTSVFRANYTARHSERLDLWDRSTNQHLPPEIETRTAIWDLAENLDREGVLALEDVMVEPLMAARFDYLRQHDVRSLLIAPIFVGGTFYGVATFSTIGQQRKWGAEEIQFARSLADLIALLILTDRYRESLAALDLIDDGIYVEGEDGRIIYANRAALRMAGRDGAPEPQQSLFGSFPVTFPRPSQALQGDHDRQEVALDLGDGHRDLMIERGRLPDGGTIVLVRDITPRRTAERERERLERQLTQAHKLEAIGQMAGGIAHDFNNLLGAIGGFAHFLEEDLKSGSDQHQYARRILAACERGKALVAQILSFAKMRNIERHPIDLHALLDGSRDLIAGLAGPSTQMSIDIEDAPMPILGNDAQVMQLIVNLCANANDALGGEPGTVSLRARRIARGEAVMDKEDSQLSLFDDKYRRLRMFGKLDPQRDYVRIDVSDSGNGIAPQLLPRIFEPFFTTKHRYGGTGLGLAVVQSVVTYYEGVLYVDSLEGRGTTFSVYLPLAEGQAEAPVLPATAAAKTKGTERVLIVDDDMDVADMLSIGLGRFGYEVATLNDPQEALAAFSEDPASWDVAVIDRVMPEMDGIALAGRLRAIRADLRVILCTGLDDGSFDHADGVDSFDLFYTKPVAPEQIAGAIRALFDR
jgi:PAS domain S-box-containing protein